MPLSTREIIEAEPDYEEIADGAALILDLTRTDYNRFFLEFIQNADDVEASSISMDIRPDRLIIVHEGGRNFEEKDIKSIKSLAHSTKTPGESIGYIGVGFKSALGISDQVLINSGQYSLKFERTPDDQNWIFRPKDNSRNDKPLNEDKKTKFTIYLNKRNFSEYYQQFHEKPMKDLVPDLITTRTFLFLNNLTHLNITRGDKEYSLEKTVRNDGNIGESQLIEIVENGEQTNHWFLKKEKVSVYPDVRENTLRSDNRLFHRTNEFTQISCAIKLDQKGELEVEKSGTVKNMIYSYFPLKEFEVSINFLIQGDFITDPNRAELHQHMNVWNGFVAGSIGNLIVEWLDDLIKHKDYRKNCTEIFYMKSNLLSVFEEIRQKVNGHIEENNFGINSDGNRVPLDELMYWRYDGLEHHAPEVIGKKHITHKDFKTERPSIPKGPGFTTHGPDQYHSNLVKILKNKNDAKDNDVFRMCVFKIIEEKIKNKVWTGDSPGKATRWLELPTKDGVWKDYREFDQEDLLVGKENRETLSYVFKALKTPETSIAKKKDLFSERLKRWETLNAEEKIALTVELARFWTDSDLIETIKESVFRVLTTSEKWIDLKKITVFFSGKYNKHRLESIYGDINMPKEFVSTKYLESTDVDQGNLIALFEELGVDKKIRGDSKGTIIGEIGELLVMKELERRGYNPTQTRDGRDLDCDIDGKRTEVEVKSRGAPSSNDWNFNLTKNEVQHASESLDPGASYDYRLYLVTGIISDRKHDISYLVWDNALDKQYFNINIKSKDISERLILSTSDN